MRCLPVLLVIPAIFFIYYPQQATGVSAGRDPVSVTYTANSWPWYLQHLTAEHKPVLDYTGATIINQEKHFAVLNFDIGNSDLQQCADALMRLRAEYLYSEKKYGSIGFHFNSGIYYSLPDYLTGLRPGFRGRKQILAHTSHPVQLSHAAMRKYLDIVYAYANTVSLCKELIPANHLETGTVIIFPGNPGHCCMIIEAALFNKRDTVFKIAEGYMPAQSIYILANPFEPDINPWYHLGPGEIQTASCTFRSYYLRKFE